METKLANQKKYSREYTFYYQGSISIEANSLTEARELFDKTTLDQHDITGMKVTTLREIKS